MPKLQLFVGQTENQVTLHREQINHELYSHQTALMSAILKPCLYTNSQQGPTGEKKE